MRKAFFITAGGMRCMIDGLALPVELILPSDGRHGTLRFCVGSEEYVPDQFLKELAEMIDGSDSPGFLISRA